MVLLRSLCFLFFLFFTIFLFAVPISVLGWLIPYPLLARAGQVWGKINISALKLICGLGCNRQGWENLPETNCIVLCKHQSAWETIALRAMLPAEHTWVVKRELLWTPIFGWGLAAYRPIAIDRKSGRQAIRQLVKEGQRWLELGRWVVVFPEGTRVAPGEHRRYGIGGALLAQKTGYPVVPIAHNAGVFWRRREIRKYPGTIDMVVGPLIDPAGLTAMQLNQRVEEWIESTVESLPGIPGENAKTRRVSAKARTRG